MSSVEDLAQREYVTRRMKVLATAWQWASFGLDQKHAVIRARGELLGEVVCGTLSGELLDEVRDLLGLTARDSANLACWLRVRSIDKH